jgi:branched-chain amino acid transport system ATP-binding protein
MTGAATSKVMLAVEDLCAWYGAAQILYGLSFEVRRGEVVAFMGRNGAGKSTTLKTIMGLMARRSGTVRFDGRDISRLEPFQIARLGLGYTPEDRRIFSDLTVLENLDLGRQPLRMRADGTPVPTWTTNKLFALFPNLAAMPNRPGGRMSGGEQQMLSVARTLMGNPTLVLLDEPSEGVAPIIVERMASTILKLKQEGLSVLLSEQNVNFSKIVADRVYVLEKGQIRWDGSMAELAGNMAMQRDFLTV